MSIGMWALTVWGISNVLLAGVVAIASKGKPNLWKDDDKAVSAAVILAIMLIAPFIIPWAAWLAAGSGIRWLRRFARDPSDPYFGGSDDWLRKSRDLFVADLVRLRQKVDPLLKRTKIGDWLIWEFKQTPENLILDVSNKYRQLHLQGISDRLIWEKLEAFRSPHGEGTRPEPCDVKQYIEYRLSLEYPGYLRLGRALFEKQVTLCERYLSAQPAPKASWPPEEWLERQLSIAEFESMGDGIDPMRRGAPAALHLSGLSVSGGLMDLKYLMLSGDELWTFSSPREVWDRLAGRAGVALVRNGKVVAHIVTKMN